MSRLYAMQYDMCALVTLCICITGKCTVQQVLWPSDLTDTSQHTQVPHAQLLRLCLKLLAIWLPS